MKKKYFQAKTPAVRGLWRAEQVALFEDQTKSKPQPDRILNADKADRADKKRSYIAWICSICQIRVQNHYHFAAARVSVSGQV